MIFQRPPVRGQRLLLMLLGATSALGAAAQSSDVKHFSDMRWRLVGPHRAGRIWSVAGVPGDPSVYLAGTPAGALWKSTSGGTTWRSISDALPSTRAATRWAAESTYLEYLGDTGARPGGGYFGIRAFQYFGFPFLEQIKDLDRAAASRR